MVYVLLLIRVHLFLYPPILNGSSLRLLLRFWGVGTSARLLGGRFSDLVSFIVATVFRFTVIRFRILNGSVSVSKEPDGVD